MPAATNPSIWATWAPETGLLGLLLAGAAGLLAALVPLRLRTDPSARALLGPLALVQLIGCTLAFASLWVSLLADDFSVLHVQANSHSDLPVGYKLAALWGAHEGSLLLWVLLLAIWGLASPVTGALPARSVLGAITAAFIAFTALTSNPFERLLPLPPTAGADLNPLLQHPAMAIHPPLLYAGYTGMALCFALALSALVEGRFDRPAALRMRTGVLVPLALLTAGIALGSWWAYQELGWGGWWFWDPVENLSALPWLTAIALLHLLRSALSSAELRDSSRCLILAVLCFPLAVMGAFMVRSGLLVSVHSFSSDPSRGLFLLLLLGLISVPALALLLRIPATRTRERHLTSREAFSLLAATLAALAALTLLLGTLYPLLYEIVTGERATVGAPYFELVLSPLALIGVIALLLVPFSGWRRPLQLSGIRRPGALRWRMLLAHAGVLLAGGAAFLQAALGQQEEVLIRPGEYLQIQAGKLHFDRMQDVEAVNYRAERAHFRLQRPDGSELMLYPEKRSYFPRGQVLTETAIERVGIADLYLALGQADDQGQWSLRVHYKPFITLLWLGAGLIVLALLIPGGANRKSSAQRQTAGES